MACCAAPFSCPLCSITTCNSASIDARNCLLKQSKCSARAARHCWQFSQSHTVESVASISNEGSIPVVPNDDKPCQRSSLTDTYGEFDHGSGTRRRRMLTDELSQSDLSAGHGIE